MKKGLTDLENQIKRLEEDVKRMQYQFLRYREEVETVRRTWLGRHEWDKTLADTVRRIVRDEFERVR